MLKVRWQWVMTGMMLALTACAPAAQEQDLGFGAPAPADESTLIVQNDYLGELDIYAVIGSSRMRLGTVRTGSTAKLRLPSTLLVRPEIQLQADPVGPDGAFTFPAFPVRPGTTVELLVATRLPMSSYSVW